jgi:hypothetical protein
MELMDEAQARAWVHGMLDSREWWVIPWLNGRVWEVSLAIEERYYGGGGDGDFIALQGPVSITAGRKSRMSSGELGEILSEVMGMRSATEWAETLETQDILVVLDPGEDMSQQVLAIAAWHEWVMGRVSLDEVGV